MFDLELLQFLASQLPIRTLVTSSGSSAAPPWVGVNVCLALGMNLAMVLAAATVGIPLWLSVAMDNLGLIVVLANSAWPLYWRVSPAAPMAKGSEWPSAPKHE